MDTYATYIKVRNTAWQTLVDFNVCKLPVKVSSICRNANIRLVTFRSSDKLLASLGLTEKLQKHSGAAIYHGRQWHILYDDTQSIARTRFTIAHELGHIFLGHITDRSGLAVMLRSRANTGDYNPDTRDPDERAADMFAARLLAPLCVLNAIGARTPEAMMKTCGISITAAKIRAKRLESVTPHDKFGDQLLEQQVLSRFSNYINSCKK